MNSDEAVQGHIFGSKVLKVSIKSNVHISNPDTDTDPNVKLGITLFRASLNYWFSLVSLLQVMAVFLPLKVILMFLSSDSLSQR